MKASDLVLSESFDSNVESAVLRASPDKFVTEAIIGGRRIKFSATMLDQQTDNSVWEIQFVEADINKTSMTYKKTGSGNEMQVFSFVIDSVKELVARYKPSEIQFGSHRRDANRSSLYQRILSRIKLPGYHVGDTESDKHTDTFRIIKD